MVHIHFGYFLPINYGNKYPLIYLLGKKNEELIANYQTKPQDYAKWRSNELMMENIFGYGLGDGGHGPIELEILAVEHLRKLYRKKVKHNQHGDIYTMFKKYINRWAIWNDEWYLDVHRGTYTSVSRVKRGNRLSENELESIEKLASILLAIKIGLNKVSRHNLEEHWKLALYNQFHDILPGSSIPEVYLDYDKDLEKINSFIKTSYEEMYFRILNMYKDDSIDLIPFIIYNPLSWNRSDVIELEIGDRKQGTLKKYDGTVIPTVIVHDAWGSLNSNKNKNLALTRIANIPSMGFSVCYFDENYKYNNIERNNNTQSQDNNTNKLNYNETPEHYIIKNERLIVKINKKTGWITHIEDTKVSQENVLRGESNKILIFEEKEHTDAWNIDPNYQDHQLMYDETDFHLELIENSPIRITFNITRKIKKSTFIQRISLAEGSSVLKLSMDIDLKNPRWLVKLNFDTNLRTNIVTSEIAYSFIDRTIVHTTKLDSARWEHACQKYVSIYDKNLDIGFSILNNGKYGLNSLRSKAGNVIIRPTVVRSPKYTGYAGETMFINRAEDGGLDPNMPRFTDLEYHKDIQFGICVHNGDWRNGIWRKAYELNHPLRFKLLPTPKNNHNAEERNKIKQDIKNKFSFLEIDPISVQCGTFKVAEDEPNVDNPSEFILRLIEREGKETEVTLRFPTFIEIKRAMLMDLLESNKIKNRIPKISKNNVIVTIKPYEIITLKIKIKCYGRNIDVF
ncbi:MAG: hypothetical protein GF364_07870 [Candidatus Lokiarchaeota archaeon]|nr:hypothetical protein [Candidatus Lokiarchaeota archaeon]